MTVKALMPVRMNLVVPLPHEGTAMRSTETAAVPQARSGAVTPLIGSGLRCGDVDSTNTRSTATPTPTSRTSTTATRTTTTRTTRSSCEPSADPSVAFPFRALVDAYVDCRRHKRSSASAQAFEAHLERNLLELHQRLNDRSYRPGRSICFVVTRPKPREIWAADFADRVVHHLLYQHVAPGFLAAFTADSCACIPGRGTLYAAQRLEHQVRSITQNWGRPAHYLKCDIANFFVSIDKTILRGLLHARIHEPAWRWLADVILMHDPRDNVQVRGRPADLALVPPHKSLFNAPAHCGLPIGNLSSQFFANVYLDTLDQFVKHRLRVPRYVRYVDDFVLLHESPQVLNGWREAIAAFLPARLGIELNPRKTVLQPAARGIDFVGHVIRPWRRVTRPKIVAVARQRVASMPAEDVLAAANSYLGLLGQATRGHVDRARIANVVRRRGHSVRADFGKAYRAAIPRPP